MVAHRYVSPGQMHVPYNWVFPDGLTREQQGSFSAEDCGKLALQQSDNTLWLLSYHAPPSWVRVGGGNAPAENRARQYAGITVAPSDVYQDKIEIALKAGCVYVTRAIVTGGSSDNVDIEFGNGSFDASPSVLYKIGTTGEGAPIWDPQDDGNWVDRTPWGFDNLDTGELYFQITNNGATSVTITIEIVATGEAVAMAAEAEV